MNCMLIHKWFKLHDINQKFKNEDMKIRYYKLLTLSLLLIIGGACIEDNCDYDTLFPEEYNVVFAMKNSLNETYTVERSAEASIYTVTVLKGGAQPALTGDVRVEPWTAEEIENYGVAIGRTYKLLPSTAYTLSETNLHFDGTARGIDIFVTFNQTAVYDFITNNREAICILPLRLVSQQTVDSKKESTLIEVKVK